jgi:UDP-N-acetylmuramate--alanine ligase
MLHVVTEGKYTIAITGTHGKTTTTAMIGEMLLGLGKDPSIIVGSLLKDKNRIENPDASVGAGSNLVVGKSDLFVVEGCEYRRSFLNISPKILVITNIEPDHLDYYKDIDEIEKAFCEMMVKVPNDGAIILNKKELEKSTVLVQCYTEATKRDVRVVDYMEYVEKVPKLKIPGLHNRKNAACALAVAEILHIDSASAQEKLTDFSGTWRRFDFKGTTSNGVLVYDDYAHHPTEIMATLSGARELFKDKKLVVIFQPHLFSRTKSLFKEFSESFADADEIILLPIYKAREVDDGTVSSKQLMEEMKKKWQKRALF